MPLLVSQGIAELMCWIRWWNCINFWQSLPLALLNLYYMKLGLPLDLLNFPNEADSAVKLKLESTFELLPNPVFVQFNCFS